MRGATQYAQEKIKRALSLVLIDGISRIDLLRAYLGAIADGRAAPGAILRVDKFHALCLRSVPRVAIVPLQQSHRSRADEVWILPELRASRITQHAIDAVAEWLVSRKLGWSLQIFAFVQPPWRLRNQVRIDAFDLFDKSVDTHHQVAFDRKMRERLDRKRPRVVIAQKSHAGEFGLRADHHAAAAADRHPARPAEAERPIEMIFDVLKPLQHRHVVGEWHPIGPRRWLRIRFGSIPQHLNHDLPRDGARGSIR